MNSTISVPHTVDPPKKTVVQTVNGQKIVLVSDAQFAFGEVAGDESLSGRVMSTAPIVDLVDHAAGALAERVTVDQGIVTASIDRVDIRSPIAHGDFLQMKARVVSLGRTSIVVQMIGYRFDVEQAQLVEVASAFATFVAVDFEKLKPKPGLPKLVHPTDSSYVPKLEAIASRHKKLAARWRATQKRIDQLPHVSADMLEDCGHDFLELVSVPDTVVKVQMSFLPKHCNRNFTIYGAEIVTFMDKVALRCARGFSRNKTMVTESMSRIAFHGPIRMDDVVEFVARICSVRKYHVDVEVEVFVCFVHSKERRKATTGYFTVANLDETYQKKHLSKGLLVDEEDQEIMRTLLKAQHRYALDSEKRKVSPLDPLEFASTSNAKTVIQPSLRGRL